MRDWASFARRDISVVEQVTELEVFRRDKRFLVAYRRLRNRFLSVVPELEAVITGMTRDFSLLHKLYTWKGQKLAL